MSVPTTPSARIFVRDLPRADRAGVFVGYRLRRVLGDGVGFATWAGHPVDEPSTAVEVTVADQPPGAFARRGLRRLALRLRAARMESWSGFHEIGCRPGRPAWFAEERATGPTLDALVEKAGPDTVRSAVLRAAQALASAHEAGVFHGELDATALRVLPTAWGVEVRFHGLGRRRFVALVRGEALSDAELAAADVTALRRLLIAGLDAAVERFAAADGLRALRDAVVRAGHDGDGVDFWLSLSRELGVRVVRREPESTARRHHASRRGMAGNAPPRLPSCRRLVGLLRRLFGGRTSRRRFGSDD